MINLGTVGTVISGIELLKEVLEKSGVDASKAGQIAGEFMSKLRVRGNASAGADRGAEQPGTAEAFVQESFEYSVLTLRQHKVRRGRELLVPAFRDGAEISSGNDAPLPELAAYLNQLADDDWEIAGEVGGASTPTILLRRVKSEEGT